MQGVVTSIWVFGQVAPRAETRLIWTCVWSMILGTWEVQAEAGSSLSKRIKQGVIWKFPAAKAEERGCSVVVPGPRDLYLDIKEYVQ